MSPVDAVDEVLELLDTRGHEHHGEVVDQRRHALQCASLARAAGAPDHLVVAALLHDIGHLVAPGAGGHRDLSVDDDHHEAVGARWVAPRFGPDVAGPVALHVVAKRYRCTVDPGYRAALSPASVQTLEAQGGLLDVAGRSRFEAHPAAAAALDLRSWDEAAKVGERVSPSIDVFVPELRRLATGAGKR